MSSARGSERRWRDSCDSIRTNIAQKTEVMVEHFNTITRHELAEEPKPWS